MPGFSLGPRAVNQCCLQPEPLGVEMRRAGPLAVLYLSIKRLPTQAQLQSYTKLAFLTISVFLGLLGEGCSSIGALALLCWRQELVASFLYPGSPGEWHNYLQSGSSSKSLTEQETLPMAGSHRALLI